MKCRESAYRLQFSRVMDVLVFRLQQRGQDVHVIVLQHVSDHSDQHCASANCCCYKQCQTNFAKSAHCKRIHRMSVQVQAKVRSVQASTRRPVVLICSFNFQPTVFLSVWLLTFFWHNVALGEAKFCTNWHLFCHYFATIHRPTNNQPNSPKWLCNNPISIQFLQCSVPL